MSLGCPDLSWSPEEEEDGGDGPQMWRLAANVLSRKAVEVSQRAVVLQFGEWVGG